MCFTRKYKGGVEAGHEKLKVIISAGRYPGEKSGDSREWTFCVGKEKKVKERNKEGIRRTKRGLEISLHIGRCRKQ